MYFLNLGVEGLSIQVCLQHQCAHVPTPPYLAAGRSQVRTVESIDEVISQRASGLNACYGGGVGRNHLYVYYPVRPDRPRG